MLKMLNHTLLFKSLGSVRFLKKNYFTFIYIYIYIYIYKLHFIYIIYNNGIDAENSALYHKKKMKF